MKIAVNTLEGAALDYAVVFCEGFDKGLLKADRLRVLVPHADGGGKIFNPSTNWSQAGPIIDREKISIVNAAGDAIWSAYLVHQSAIKGRKSGPTALIAAMRCYVASKLGDEVEIPDSLLRFNT